MTADELAGTEWIARAAKLAAEHEAIAGEPEPSRAVLMRALVDLYLLGCRAPAVAYQRFRLFAEADLAVQAERRRDELPTRGLAWNVVPDDLDASLRNLAVQARAIDAALHDRSTPPFGNPRRMARHCRLGADGEDGWFLVPRPNPRPHLDPSRNHHFDLRGMVKHRLLPTRHRGMTVELRWVGTFTPADRRERPLDALPLAAALFDGFEVRDPDVETVETGFVFRDVSCRDGPETVDDQVRGAREAGCFAVVWPELTMPPRLRERLVGALKRTAGPDAAELKAAVAGSWHERDGEDYVNEALIVNGFGTRLYRYRKIIPYIDGKNIQEGIRSGTNIPVLVTDEGLIAVAICRDFCERRRSHYPDLDVDFVLVPSLGDAAALEGHEATAGEMRLRHGTRSFVVQQCLPREQDHLGWVVDTRRPRTRGVPQASTFLVYPRHEALD